MPPFVCCLLFAAAGATALELGRPQAGSSAGQKLGRLVAASAEQEPTDEVARQKVMSKELTPDVLVNEKVSEVVARANKQAAAEEVAPDAVNAACVQNLSHACPESWTRQEQFCKAPRSYTGPCSRRLSSTLSFRQRAQAAEECNSPWPCEGLCARNLEGCPTGWEPAGSDGTCAANGAAVLAPGCAPAYNVLSLNNVQKQLLSSQCGLSWPCAEDCIMDLAAACPDGWRMLGGLCVAAVEYPSAGCEFAINATGWAQPQKYEFAQRCNVAWGACSGSSAAKAPHATSRLTLNEKNGPVDGDGSILDAKPQGVPVSGAGPQSSALSGPVDSDGVLAAATLGS
ncbi:unnamed protein product [Effrenium voratum]|nr:unnamed protein product [Effrenium voratum]